MSQRRHKLVRVVIAIVAMSMLVMSTRLWSSPGVPTAYAIPCGINCENITNTPSVSLTLNGSDQTVSYTLTFSLNNVSILGWNVTITSTKFTTGSPVHTLAPAASSVTGVTAVCTGGQICTTLPQNAVTYPVAVPAGNLAPPPVKFYNAQSGSGVGTFDISTAINITVPANAYAGTYTSTITLAYVSGP
jgi:hypothetical protein